jgi:hypothetical protein
MSRAVQLSTGEILTSDEFRAAHTNIAYGGQFPSRSFLSSLGATLVEEEVYPDLASAREAMLGFINDLTKKITDQYPAAEVSAWPSKAEAARAVIAGTARADQTAMIQDEADLTVATLTDQAAAIVAKAEVFEAIIAKASGLRQVIDAWLVGATTSAEREAVLDYAQVQVAALAAAYGL